MTRSATFRFYGDLNDFLAREHRRRDLRHAFFGTPSVKDAVEALGVPHTEVALILVNGAPAGFGCRLTDGDRVVVYPAFASLPLSPVLTVTREPPQLRFVLDGHLGRLAAKLRMLGYDALWTQNPPDDVLARISEEEDRVLLTRDVGLLKRGNVTWGAFVRATHPTEQIVEVGRRYGLQRFAAPFTRCLRCNGTLAAVEKAEIEAALPPRVREGQEDFRRCLQCGHLYWRGTHFKRMEAAIADLLGRL